MSTLAISLPRIARHNPLAAVGVVLVSIFVFSAVFAPWIAPQDPAHIDLPNRLQTPSTQHWCGTDELGRDILSRLIWGARISLFVGSSVVACSLLLGLIIGSLAGYHGGAIDRFVNVVLMNAFLSFPGILIAIAFVAFRGPGIFNLVLALSLGGWVGYARLVRAQVLAVREREFVEAARALADVALGEEALRGADDHALFVGGDAELGERGELFACGARAYFDEGEGITVVADQIDFAFGAARHEVACDEDVAVAPEIPVGVGFAANTGSAGYVFFRFRRRSVPLAQSFSRGPVNDMENQS